MMRTVTILFAVLSHFVYGAIGGRNTGQCDRTNYLRDFSYEHLYSQLVEIDGTFYGSGQNGWNGTGFADGLDAQINQAFDNIDTVLASAGLVFDDVLSIITYTINREDNHNVSAIKSARYPSAYPAWTALTIRSLFYEDMLIEIKFIAKKAKRNGQPNICEIDIDSDNTQNVLDPVQHYDNDYDNDNLFQIPTGSPEKALIYFMVLNVILSITIVCIGICIYHSLCIPKGVKNTKYKVVDNDEDR